MIVAIRGIGPIGAFGTGRTDLAEALDKHLNTTSQTGQHLETVFKTDTSTLSNFVAAKKLRRMDHYACMVLLSAGLALKDAGLSAEEKKETGIILATGHGPIETGFSFLESFIDKGDSLSKPTRFSTSVHTFSASSLSLIYGIEGPVLNVADFDLPFISAIITAVAWLKEKRVSHVLVGGVDELSKAAMYAAPVPHPGEGGCFFILSEASNAAIDLAHADIFDPGAMDPAFLQDYCFIGREMEKNVLTPVMAPWILTTETLYGNFPSSAALDLACAAILQTHSGIAGKCNVNAGRRLGSIRTGRRLCGTIMLA